MSLRKRSLPVQFLISILSVCGVAGICFLCSAFLDYRITAFVLLVTVSILAVLFDIFPVLTAAALSAVIWDLLFIPPRFTFFIEKTEDRILFLTYFIIASVNAVLTYKLRQMEKAARDKEEKENAIRLYNTLFNSLSHELKTPISTIIGLTDALKDDDNKLSHEKKQELLDEISIASLRLNEQVSNLLNMSRLESGQLKLKNDWCDVNELFHTVVEKIKDRAGSRRISIAVSPTFPLVKLDAGIMEQILYNLVNNAVQYTPEKTSILLSAKIKDHKSALSTTETHSMQTLIIRVSDDGPGFQPEEIEKVFLKFYRSKHSGAGGTGLGLSIVKGFVEAQKGSVHLHNLEAGGAEFVIELPCEISDTSFLHNE
ncbi:MAG TPA: ATP-binding protein [Bacteroidia bacterium]|jgi:two-component system sensor histidine kinase KdpD|nr:ATP-binding protein [Bacteroidia bacterium]